MSTKEVEYAEHIEPGASVDMRALIRKAWLRNATEADWFTDGVVIQDTGILSDDASRLDLELKVAAYCVAAIALQRTADMLMGRTPIDRKNGITPTDAAQVLTALKAFGVTPENTRKARKKKGADVLPIGKGKRDNTQER